MTKSLLSDGLALPCQKRKEESGGRIMSGFTVIVDSREQKWQHVREGFDRLGVPWVRSKLYVGDYARLDNMTHVIDRKYGLQEVAGNLIQEHERFRRECVRAMDAGIRITVLIEEKGVEDLEAVRDWKNPRRSAWDRIKAAHDHGRMLSTQIPKRPPVNGVMLQTIMATMALKYRVEWKFTTADRCAGDILDILAQVGRDEDGSGVHGGA